MLEQPDHTEPAERSVTFSLDGDSAAGEPGQASVPTKPTAVMLAAGARAGGVSVETAWKVYQSMVQKVG